jgi:hypothetical protein
LYFSVYDCAYKPKKFVGVFVRFRAPLQYIVMLYQIKNYTEQARELGVQVSRPLLDGQEDERV